MDAATLAELYRNALAERDDAVRASLANSVAQTAAASSALAQASPPELSADGDSRGDSVRQLQLLLAARGHDVRVDGVYDEDTSAAVMSFQKAANIEATGATDRATWAALTAASPNGHLLLAQAEAAVDAAQTALRDALGSSPVDRDAAESIAAEALAAEALAAEALAGEPLAAEPLAAEPFAAEPFAAEPFAAEPLAAEPFAAEPLAAEPFAAEPLAAEPFAAEPFAAEPFAAEPFIAMPVAESDKPE
jgi:hypothetical protein